MAQETEQQAFSVEVFTPRGPLLQGTALSVKLPLNDGEAGVGINHRQYTGLLGTGIMEFKCQDSNSVKRIALDRGFCSFASNTLTVLADAAELPETIDRDNYAKDREKLQALVQADHRDNPEQKQAIASLRRIEAIDRLISH